MQLLNTTSEMRSLQLRPDRWRLAFSSPDGTSCEVSAAKEASPKKAAPKKEPSRRASSASSSDEAEPKEPKEPKGTLSTSAADGEREGARAVAIQREEKVAAAFTLWLCNLDRERTSERRAPFDREPSARGSSGSASR